jgi:putative FmdB family regulatory protein
LLAINNEQQATSNEPPMPTYEYRCSGCGHHFEKFQSITATPISRCPQCGKKKVQRLIGTGAGLIFKGSGFYITDYRDSSYKDKAKAETGGGGDSKASTESKPDTKSDAKTPTPSESKPAAEKKPAAKTEGKPSSSSHAKKK